MSARIPSKKQMLYHNNNSHIEMALYVSCANKLFYARYDEFATNRVKAESVWIDKKGAICAKVERRNKQLVDKEVLK